MSDTKDMHSKDKTTTPPRSLRELYVAFTMLALQGFGGVLPVARHELIERRRWLSMDEFTDILARCQALPGPNIVNVGVCVGARWFGARGSLVALAGLLSVPFVLILALCYLYASFGQAPAVSAALRGVAAVAAGLIIGTALRMTASKRLRTWRALFGIGAFVAVVFLRYSVVPVLLIAAGLSLAASWLLRRGGRAA